MAHAHIGSINYVKNTCIPKMVIPHTTNWTGLDISGHNCEEKMDAQTPEQLASRQEGLSYHFGEKLHNCELGYNQITVSAYPPKKKIYSNEE